MLARRRSPECGRSQSEQRVLRLMERVIEGIEALPGVESFFAWACTTVYYGKQFERWHGRAQKGDGRGLDKVFSTPSNLKHSSSHRTHTMSQAAPLTLYMSKGGTNGWYVTPIPTLPDIDVSTHRTALQEDRHRP